MALTLGLTLFLVEISSHKVQGAAATEQRRSKTDDKSNDDDRVSFCADDGKGGYECKTRAQQISGEIGRGQLYNLGVPQRVDGSDAEKTQIQDVIAQMTDYFYTEVLAKPAYKEVRHKWYETYCAASIYEICVGYNLV